jgi:tRNA(Ile)-lysidine synthase TilS/MesJ
VIWPIETAAADGAAGKRVLLGMSGGVDSSVACFLLQEKGFQVVGLTLLTNSRKAMIIWMMFAA